jgi:hypothetical protein
VGVGFSVGFAVGLLVGDAVVPETGASITLDGVLVPPGVGASADVIAPVTESAGRLLPVPVDCEEGVLKITFVLVIVFVLLGLFVLFSSAQPTNIKSSTTVKKIKSLLFILCLHYSG